LGSEASVTTLENDALIVNNDVDDCDPILYMNASGVGYFVISVSGGPDIVTSEYCYVNILFDQNGDGEWRNTPAYTEWVANNIIVMVPQNSHRRVVCGPFNVNLTFRYAWIRITLTREWIIPRDFTDVGGWDGSGPAYGFEYGGETEDWYFDVFDPQGQARIREFPCHDKQAAVVATLNSQRGGGNEGCHGSIPCDKTENGWLWWWWHNEGCVAVDVTDILFTLKPCSVDVDILDVVVRKNLGVVPFPNPQNPITLQPCETLRVDIIVQWAWWLEPCEAKMKIKAPPEFCPVCGRGPVAARIDADLIIDPEGVEYYAPSSPVRIILDNQFNITITNITLSKTAVGQGYSTGVNVTVTNTGDQDEDTKVILCAERDITIIGDGHIIGSQPIYDMPGGTSTTIMFAWNTSGYAMGNYTISAFSINNTFVDGTVLVTWIGDINGDKKVDLKDVFAEAVAYGSNLGSPKYSPNLDINDDDKIDLKDYLSTVVNYGKEW